MGQVKDIEEGNFRYSIGNVKNFRLSKVTNSRSLLF